MSSHLTPLEVCHRTFGSLEALAEAIGYDRKTAYKWRKPAQHRKAGDLPSMEVARKVLAAARERGLPLTVDHLMFGATPGEFEAFRNTVLGGGRGTAVQEAAGKPKRPADPAPGRMATPGRGTNAPCSEGAAA